MLQRFLVATCELQYESSESQSTIFLFFQMTKLVSKSFKFLSLLIPLCSDITATHPLLPSRLFFLFEFLSCYHYLQLPGLQSDSFSLKNYKLPWAVGEGNKSAMVSLKSSERTTEGFFLIVDPAFHYCSTKREYSFFFFKLYHKLSQHLIRIHVFPACKGVCVEFFHENLNEFSLPNTDLMWFGPF